MKNTIFLILISVLGTLTGQAQDAYHNNLQTWLQTNYGLPAATWVLFNTESGNLNGASHYGNNTTVLSETGQPFSLKSRIFVAQAGNAPFSSGWSLKNKIAIQQGDILLATFYIRSLGGDGKVNFFIEDAVSYNKEVILTMPVDTQWQRYLVPFESSDYFPLNDLTFGFHLGYQAQTIEVGGFTALNYGTSAQLSDLPEAVNNEFYGGWEPNAPWRAVAAGRIDQFRKIDLGVEIEDSNGLPLANAGINVKMLRHDFAFGTAIKAKFLAGNNGYNSTYENKLINLDGKGHGFPAVVFENDLKWPAWENEWSVNKTELVNAITWLRNQNISIRGHTLLWPGIDHMPNDIGTNISDLNYIKNRINNHLDEILTWPGVQGEIDEWDVLNEITTNQDLENAFKGTSGYPTGRELYAEVFNTVRQKDPNIGLWINDYITISQTQEAGAAQYDSLKAYIQDLIDAQTDLEGIGFQGHIGAFPNGIPAVLQTLDDFHNSFGLKAKVTEFTLPTAVNDTLAANYLRDFLTATFSHPSMDGFLFWNFWDGSTWKDYGANLFRQDWTRTLAGDAFVDLVFDDWWTDETLTTDNTGTNNIRAFKGLYEISYTCDGVVVRDTVNLVADSTFTIICDKITTGLDEFSPLQVEVFPNPSDGRFHIRREEASLVTIRLNDIHGRQVFFEENTSETITLDAGYLPAGVYVLHITGKAGHYFEKLVVE